MLKNYWKTAIRNLWRYKSYSLINIVGMAVSMASSILILLWVQHETSYDRFHQLAGRIYRITAAAGDFKVAVNPIAMAPALRKELPAVADFTRITSYNTILFEKGDQRFEEKKTLFVDSNFLQVFTFPLVKGDKQKVLGRPDAILLTESMARKYFGKEDPIGKTLKKDNAALVTVTGILADVPSNSHLQFDFLMPMSAIAQTNEDIKQNKWDNFNFYTYLVMGPTFDGSPTTVSAFEKNMDRIYKNNEKVVQVTFQLQPLTKIHLYSKLQAEIGAHGNVQYVNIFFIVAIFILVIACINFMNLATARSARRAREVGMRKAIGAGRAQLIGQFLGESVVIAMISLILSIGLVLSFLPTFNYIAGKQLSIHFLDFRLWLGLIGLALLTGLISGSYPALFLSHFQPVTVLKGTGGVKSGNVFFRHALVITQFIVSILLLAGTIVVYQQLNYIRNRDLGFDKENLLYMPMTGDLWNKLGALRAELKANTLTSDYVITSDLPTNLSNGTISVVWDGKDPNEQVIFPNMGVSENFVSVFRMQLVAGRGFSEEFRADSNNYVLNEKAVEVMKKKPAEVIGKPFTLWDRKGVIVGVVKNFNYKPVQQAIEPMVIFMNRWGGSVVVRTKPGQSKATINALEKINHALNPVYPFSFGFLDQDIDNMYKGERQLGTLFNIFAILAILISCLGLYGLSAFIAEQRTREIGIRKVLGASVLNIVYLLSGGITRLILLAALIAVPLSWWSIHNWLDNFAYHINPSWIIFGTSAVCALFVAWITVGYESIRAALTKPVRSLKAE